MPCDAEILREVWSGCRWQPATNFENRFGVWSVMPGCRAPIPSKHKQKIGALFCRKRSIEMKPAVTLSAFGAFIARHRIRRWRRWAASRILTPDEESLSYANQWRVNYSHNTAPEAPQRRSKRPFRVKLPAPQVLAAVPKKKRSKNPRLEDQTNEYKCDPTSGKPHADFHAFHT